MKSLSLKYCLFSVLLLISFQNSKAVTKPWQEVVNSVQKIDNQSVKEKKKRTKKKARLKKMTKALWSLSNSSVGAFSIILAAIFQAPTLFLIGVAFCTVGFILGIIALKKKQGKKSHALTGLIMGAVGIGMFLLLLMLIALIFSSLD